MPTASTRRQLTMLALQCLDLCIFSVAFIVACQVESISISAFTPSNSWKAYLWILMVIPCWYFSLRVMKLYTSHRLSTTKTELLHILSSVTFATGLIAVIALLLELEFISLRMIALIWLITVLLMIISRMLIYQFLRWLRLHGRNLRFVLVVGYGGRAKDLIQTLHERSDLGYSIIGCVDVVEDLPGIAESSRPDIILLGGLDDFPSILANNVVDEVFVTLPIRSYYDRISNVISQCWEQGVPVRLPFEIFSNYGGYLHIETLNTTPILTLAPLGWSRQRYDLVKRVIDLSSSILLLILLAPLFLIMAILIKMDSPGPVFFVQQRIGFNKRMFKMFKFRTMIKDGAQMQQELEHMNEADGPVFKISNDPRVTRLGDFLRKTSLDEIPQIINVLKGEMSLVGPRPLPLRDVKGFTVDWQRRRFTVLPGMTCLWQASGRSDVSFQQWMEMDMDYIDRASLQLDMKIMLQTVSAVFRRQGAY